jgi:hypothetical protein
VLVLDDGPGAAGWPHVCRALAGLSAAADGCGQADSSAAARDSAACPHDVSRGPPEDGHGLCAGGSAHGSASSVGLCGGGRGYGSASLVRYVAMPADPATGRVCLRLKRNLALELATVYRSDWILFFDDDDWRSEGAAQASKGCAWGAALLLDVLSHK